MKDEKTGLDEDEIIAAGLRTIRCAMLAQDWQQVFAGYNLISGEDLQVPEKPKTRLEKIRESIAGKEDNTPETKKGSARTRKVKLPDENKELPENAPIDSKKMKGGKNFGFGEINVISVPIDDKEVQRNKELNALQAKMPKIERPAPLVDTAGDENKPVGFSSNPSKRPPWE